MTGSPCSLEGVLALLAPGQGSQTPGMLSPWLEVEGTRERLAAWSELAGLDLVELGTVADADAIKDTSVTQPLVVATALLAHDVLAAQIGRASCRERVFSSV